MSISTPETGLTMGDVRTSMSQELSDLAALKQAVAALQSAPAGVTQTQLNAALAGIAPGITATRLTATLGTGGTVTLAHGRTVAPQAIIPVARFVGNRAYWAIVGATTATQVTLTGARSKGTLLLSDGPNEAAVAGDVVEVLVLGR